MNESLKQLEEFKDCTDIEKIKHCLDKVIRALKATTLACKTCDKDGTKDAKSINKVDNCVICRKDTDKFSYLDFTVKKILQNNPTAELYDRIRDLFPLIKNPLIFSDELQLIFENSSQAVPTLMFIYEVISYYQVDYTDFYKMVLSTVTEENCCSDGYLLFVLNTLHRKFCKRVELEDVAFILQKLSEVSVEVSSRSAAKVLYTIIIILRMYPSLFEIVGQLNHIYMLLNSLEYIARIARRIFIEAANPEMRPAMVFLENFSFPDEE